jgi:hypothetical protein
LRKPAPGDPLHCVGDCRGGPGLADGVTPAGFMTRPGQAVFRAAAEASVCCPVRKSGVSIRRLRVVVR